MEKVKQIIQRNSEIVKRIKEYLDVVNLQFLDAHMYIEIICLSSRQDPPLDTYHYRMSFDSYAENLLGIVRSYPIKTGPYILNSDLDDWYIRWELADGIDLYKHVYESKSRMDVGECKKQVMNSYNRNAHIFSLVGHHCLKSVWNEELSSDEKTEAQESLILDLKTMLHLDIDSLREFSVQIDHLTFSCEVVKLCEVRLKKIEGVFGECVTYYDNSNCLTKAQSINIPFKIKWMAIDWEVIDIADGFFNNCNEVETLIFPDDLKSFNWSFWNCPKLREIKTKVRSVSSYDKRNLFSHDGVLYRFVGEHEGSFGDKCELIAYPNMHAKEYQIPCEIEFEYHTIKVISISKFAFKDCDNLEILKIPESVTKIGCNAFYRCNNLRTIYYWGFFKNLKIEGFCGRYGSVNPTWLCKTTIPSLQPKVEFTFSEEEHPNGALKFTIGGVNFKMIRVNVSNKYSSFIGETAVTRALWKIVMGDYPDGQNNEQYAVVVNYLEACEFIEKLKSFTKMAFGLPTPAVWLQAAKGGKEKIDFNGIRIQPTKYRVKSIRTNDLGLYDMFGSGELCRIIMDSVYVPLMGSAILGKVNEKSLETKERVRHSFRLYMYCENSSWINHEYFCDF